MEGEVSHDIPVIQLPRSKSICNRLLVIEALAGMPLSRFDMECADIEDMRQSILDGRDHGVCHVKESGTALRFLTAFFAIGRPIGTVTEIKCSGRLAERPIDRLLEYLVKFGMSSPEVVEASGCKTIRLIASKLKGGDIEIDTSKTTQYASALLLIAPYMNEGLTVRLPQSITAYPYIDMTVRMMKNYGAAVEVSDREIRVQPEKYKDIAVTLPVEADWSAASFFYEYIAINGGTILLEGLNPDTTLQGDGKELPWLFYNYGVTTDILDNGIEISKSESPALYVRKDFASFPDLVIPFVMTACFTGVKFQCTGIEALHHKESDRVEALKTAMQQMGFLLVSNDIDGKEALLWKGDTCTPLPKGSKIDDASDHRMAMAIEASGKGYKAMHPQCVEKSFPQFYEMLDRLKHIGR